MELDTRNTRIWLKGLAVECSLEKPLPDCPLNGVRCLPTSQLNRTINHLCDAHVETIAEYHHPCHRQRLKELRPLLR